MNRLPWPASFWSSGKRRAGGEPVAPDCRDESAHGSNNSEVVFAGYSVFFVAGVLCVIFVFYILKKKNIVVIFFRV